MSKQTIDVSQLSGWSGLSEGTQAVTVKTIVNGVEDSASSNVVTVEKKLTKQTKEVSLLMVDGDQTILPDANMTMEKAIVKKPATLIPANIKQGVSIGGVVGEMTGTGKEEEVVTVDLYMVNGNQEIVPTNNGKTMSKVIVNKPADLTKNNLVKGANIGGVIGEVYPRKEEQEKSINVSTNGTFEVNPDGFKVLSKATVNVNVPIDGSNGVGYCWKSKFFGSSPSTAYLQIDKYLSSFTHDSMTFLVIARLTANKIFINGSSITINEVGSIYHTGAIESLKNVTNAYYYMEHTATAVRISSINTVELCLAPSNSITSYDNYVFATICNFITEGSIKLGFDVKPTVELAENPTRINYSEYLMWHDMEEVTDESGNYETYETFWAEDENYRLNKFLVNWHKWYIYVHDKTGVLTQIPQLSAPTISLVKDTKIQVSNIDDNAYYINIYADNNYLGALYLKTVSISTASFTNTNGENNHGTLKVYINGNEVGTTINVDSSLNGTIIAQRASSIKFSYEPFETTYAAGTNSSCTISSTKLGGTLSFDKDYLLSKDIDDLIINEIGGTNSAV